jgi:hypothetical protein
MQVPAKVFCQGKQCQEMTQKPRTCPSDDIPPGGPSLHIHISLAPSKKCTYVLESILDSFYFSIVKVLLKIAKIDSMYGWNYYLFFRKKGIGFVRFWLSI